MAYKYLELWKHYLPLIISCIQKSIDSQSTQKIYMDQEQFKLVGNRKKSGYGFRMDIMDGVVPRKSNSAVARDLKTGLDNDTNFYNIAKHQNLTIRMGRNFVLHIISFR